jgi:predicted NAD/FAD-binding protein
MPKRRTAWSAWNYLTHSSPPSKGTSPTSGDLQTVCLTYNMNILQALPVPKYGDVLVTLNPQTPPSTALTQATYEYRHPLYNARMVAAQEKLEQIQGKKGVWFAGAWTGYGFHEDGFVSGMGVGLRLGGSVPWEAKSAKFSRGVKPVLGWNDFVARVVVWILQLYITVLERVVGLPRETAKGKAYSNGNSADWKAKVL